MEAIAKARFVKVPPRKARAVADLVRGKSVNQALAILLTVPKNASKILGRILDSAVANANVQAEGAHLDIDDLKIIELTVDGGPTTMRWRPRARGRATKIRHRTSHISLKLADGAEPGEE